MPLDPVEVLQRLIKTPSVNPMGRDVAGPMYGEAQMTAVLSQICTEQGWPFALPRVHEGRCNVVALIESFPAPEEGGELILWDVHQDTVPVDGMIVEPFGGEARDGRVYGRGACDVKGSMAAMLAALSLVTETADAAQPSLGRSRQRDEKRTRPTILIAFTVNEECGFTGARFLTQGWNNPHMTPPPTGSEASSVMAADAVAARLFWLRPDAAIVAEPTGLDVVVAHQGSVRWRCHTIGRAAHTSRPDAGANAIYAMANIVRVVEQFHSKLTNAGPQHRLCGRPSVCVSRIEGGVGINTVPERATIEIDRRLGPTEKPEEAYNELIRLIEVEAQLGACRVEHDAPFMASDGLVDLRNIPIAERVAGLVRSAGRRSELVGVPYGTDASVISAAGVPSVVFGPGSIAQAHTADEYIEIDALKFATEIFFRIATEGLDPARGVM